MDQKVIDPWKHLSDLLDEIWPTRELVLPGSHREIQQYGW